MYLYHIYLENLLFLKFFTGLVNWIFSIGGFTELSIGGDFGGMEGLLRHMSGFGDGDDWSFL